MKTRTIMPLVLGIFTLMLIGCGKPMFVATMGAKVYHTHVSPVQNALNN